MAKSIYEILADLKTSTSVPGFGAEIEHTIPAHLFPSPEQFENGDSLLEWAEKKGYTHALLQKGIQKGLIDIRATFKSCKKDDTWTVDYGQANVDKTEWTITNKPNQKKNISQAVIDAGTKIAQAMRTVGLADAVIRASLASFKPEEIDAILEAIE